MTAHIDSRADPYATGIGYTFQALLTAAAAICSTACAVTVGSTKLYWGAGAAGAAVATAVLAVWTDRRSAAAAREAAASRARLAATAARAAEPLVSALNAVFAASDAAECRAALTVLINCVTGHAHARSWLPVPSPADVRATFYELVGGHLERRRTVGRPDIPRAEFHPDRSVHDYEAVRVALDGHPVLVHDLRTDPPPHFEDSEGRTYRSFLATPVRAGAASYGLLVLDADQPGNFTVLDRHHVLLISAILGAGFAHLTATTWPDSIL